MRKLLILSILLLNACTSISVGTGYEFGDPHYTYEDSNGSKIQIPHWENQWVFLIRADKRIYENDNSSILLEYEHISSAGDDHATYDGLNAIYKWRLEE